jgi:hypothetical protein
LTITLKGDEGLHRPEYLELVLKEKIREEAKKKLGVTIAESTEIDAMVRELQRRGEKWFKSNREYLGDFDSLDVFLEALRNQDKTALEATFEAFTQEGIHFLKNFKAWIESALKTLRENGIDGVFILWDEFTGLILDPAYASRLQNILAENEDLYLLIVTHRSYDQLSKKIDEETLQKIKDRFVFHRLEMEEVTTFHILSKVIEKKNLPLWRETLRKYWQDPKLSLIAGLISEEEKTKSITESKLKELYPFHPYTAFLITYTVNHFLSANRSIFDFLYGEKKGAFQNFLEREVEEEPFLTPDYLWDFFNSSMEEGIFRESTRGILGIYNLYKDNVSQKGENFLRVFKTILTLNLLVREADRPVKLLKPTEENIKLAYAGTPLEGKVPEILEWIDRERIVQKDPEGNFRIEEFSLSPEEVKKRERELRSRYPTTARVLKESSEILKEMEERHFSRDVLRELELHLFTDKSRLVHFLEGDSAPYRLKVVLGIPTYEKEVSEFRTTFKELSKRYPNAVFLTFDLETEEFLEKYVYYSAREIVSRSVGRGESADYYHRQADTLLSSLSENIKNSYVYFTFKGSETKETSSGTLKRLDVACREVFSSGAENLPKLNNKNLWKKGASKDFLIKVLNVKLLRELESSLRSLDRQLLDALRDEDSNYVVDEYLEVKEGAPRNHPLVALRDKLRDLLERGRILRPEDLFELQRPPFGVYNNKLYGFLLVVAFKNFEKDLYVVGRGRADVVSLQSFILQLLNGKGKGNVHLRLGSETDRRLVGVLKEVFHNYLNDYEIDDLAKLRWEIRKGINEKVGWPLWVVEYVGEEQGLKKTIDRINEFLARHEEGYSSDERKKEELLEIIEREKIDLRTLLSDPKNILRGKERFLQLKLRGRPIDRETLEGRIKRLFTNEPAFWDRGFVERRVEEIIEELLAEKEKSVKRVESATAIQGTPVLREPVSRGYVEVDRSELLQKLEGLTREEILKLLKCLIENHPELTGEIESFLEVSREGED